MVNLHVGPRGLSRVSACACLIATLPLAHGCRRESSTAVPPGGTTQESVAIPDVCLIPAFEQKLAKTGTRRRTGETYARYELGRAFPAEEFIATVRTRLTESGWLELDYSPVDPASSRYNRNRWYTIAPDQKLDLCFDAWWSRGQELVQLFLARGTNPSDPTKGLVSADISHYDESAVKRTFPTDAKRRSESEIPTADSQRP